MLHLSYRATGEAYVRSQTWQHRPRLEALGNYEYESYCGLLSASV